MIWFKKSYEICSKYKHIDKSFKLRARNSYLDCKKVKHHYHLYLIFICPEIINEIKRLKTVWKIIQRAQLKIPTAKKL
jgi:hypothetical protein